MTETEALSRMIAPGTPREAKWRQGVIQIRVTRACDMACHNCTQGSQLLGPVDFMTSEQFEQAVLSLKGYFGVYGTFGGNPCLSKHFGAYCEILRKYVPFEQRGLWANNPLKWGAECRRTFNPAVSNLNVHLSREAWQAWKRDWPESMPFGLDRDSRHSPVHVAMKDVIEDEGKRWELISNCDINQHWSAAIIVFRGELRAFFCEVAAGMASLHQHEPDYPDTGLNPIFKWHMGSHYAVPHGCMDPEYSLCKQWWELPMSAFADQVRKHCHECSVPLRGYGELAQGRTGTEQTSATHAAVYKPKVKGRPVEVVTELHQIKPGRIEKVTNYLGNARR